MKSKIKKRFARDKNNQDDNSNFKEWKPNPKGSLCSNLIEISSETKRICDSHYATFPSALSDFFIKGCTDSDDIVLDPFAGTFTTCLSAKNLGRKYCGIELDKNYCNFGMNRLN